jgi:alkaline phosphatase D
MIINSFNNSKDLTTISFGSCNKQWLPQTHWKKISDLNPDIWLWMGDVVYTDLPGGKKELDRAYNTQIENTEYQDFLSKGIIVEGIYDDHDFGVNDAGSHLPNLMYRKEKFLNFLNISRDDERWIKDRGLYTSKTYGTIGKKIKIIMLDTRTHRENFPLFNPDGNSLIPFSNEITILCRWLYGTLCIGNDHEGDILGEDQWKWLENELKDSDASIHLIISSIQVLTSNPIFESWGHFPKSKTKFINLLNKYKPNGLTILSGDIHFAEFLSGIAESKNLNKEIIEITSSGLTHSCYRDYGNFLCNFIIYDYSNHRLLNNNQYYLKENFGILDIEWINNKDKSCVLCPDSNICRGDLLYSIRDIYNNNIMMSLNKTTCNKYNYINTNDLVSPLNNSYCTLNRGLFFLYFYIMLTLFPIIFYFRLKIFYKIL